MSTDTSTSTAPTFDPTRLNPTALAEAVGRYGDLRHRAALEGEMGSHAETERIEAQAAALYGQIRALLGDTMTVTIRHRAAEAPWGVGLTSPAVRKVTISAYCWQCGERRGEPRGRNQCDDGAYYWTQVWDNPCRHVDNYATAAREAAALAAGRVFTNEPEPPPVVDANGDPVTVPESVTVTEEIRAFFAGRVPAKGCKHYMAQSEARAGFKTCERCR